MGNSLARNIITISVYNNTCTYKIIIIIIICVYRYTHVRGTGTRLGRIAKQFTRMKSHYTYVHTILCLLVHNDNIIP